jgi:hypothetical protein
MKLTSTERQEIIKEFADAIACITPIYTDAPEEFIDTAKSKNILPSHGEEGKPLCRTLMVPYFETNELSGKQEFVRNYEIVLYPENARTDQCGALSDDFPPEKVFDLLLQHSEYEKLFDIVHPDESILASIKELKKNKVAKAAAKDRSDLMRKGLDKDNVIVDLDKAAKDAGKKHKPGRLPTPAPPPLEEEEVAA